MSSSSTAQPSAEAQSALPHHADSAPSAASRYSLFNESHLFTLQQRERAVLSLLKREGQTELAGKKILDIGCGSTGWFLDWLKYGATPQNLFGLDANLERIAALKQLHPSIHAEVGDARKLPWPDGSFDIVVQSTLFSSVESFEARREIAAEMRRVLAPGGFILWYDMRFNNPRNPRVRRVGRRELRALFPSCVFRWRRVTLAPPLAQRCAGLSWTLCLLLEALPFLRTHYLVLIREETS